MKRYLLLSLFMLATAALFLPWFAQAQLPQAIQRYTEPLAPATPNMTGASITAGVATSRVALPGGGAAFNALYIFNSGAVPAFFNLGNATVNAALTNVPLPAGQTICVAVGSATNLAAITASSTAVLYIIQSEGCPSH